MRRQRAASKRQVSGEDFRASRKISYEKSITDAIESSRFTYESSIQRAFHKQTLQPKITTDTPYSRKSFVTNLFEDCTSQRVIGRIHASDRCKKALENAKNNQVPEIFIDSKEKGKRMTHLGRDAINGSSQDRSLIASGRPPQGPTSWGHVFIYLPSLDKLEVLSNFSEIQDGPPSMSILE